MTYWPRRDPLGQHVGSIWQVYHEHHPKPTERAGATCKQSTWWEVIDHLSGAFG
jgi:hypothetical protein